MDCNNCFTAVTKNKSWAWGRTIGQHVELVLLLMTVADLSVRVTPMLTVSHGGLVRPVNVFIAGPLSLVTQ